MVVTAELGGGLGLGCGRAERGRVYNGPTGVVGALGEPGCGKKRLAREGASFQPPGGLRSLDGRGRERGCWGEDGLVDREDCDVGDRVTSREASVK